jgi:hypothetical protein
MILRDDPKKSEEGNLIVRAAVSGSPNSSSPSFSRLQVGNGAESTTDEGWDPEKHNQVSFTTDSNSSHDPHGFIRTMGPRSRLVGSASLPRLLSILRQASKRSPRTRLAM